MGYMIPRFLGAGRYFLVGQIRDEGYVYGSFAKSKAYQMGARCSDCRDGHSCPMEFNPGMKYFFWYGVIAREDLRSVWTCSTAG